MIFFVSILISILFVTSINGNQFRCDYTYLSAIDGWLKFHNVPANWHEARLKCHLEGAVLASPITNKLHFSLQTFVDRKSNNASCGFFTGLHATFSRGDYFSIEGVPLWKIPENWAIGEPDNFNDAESCIIQLNSGSLADTKCTDVFPYVCYRRNDGYSVSKSCGTVDMDYTLDTRTGSCYKFHRVPRTWSRAYMACAAEGGHLVIINSDTEANVIKELFAKNPGNKMIGNFWKDIAFIGFHDWKEHGEWVTIHGQSLHEAGYEKFSGGEPNNATTGEFCGGVYRSGLLDDIWCENSYGFICEKKPDSLTCN